MFEQVLMNSLNSIAIWILVAIGFGLIYNTTRFFNFAHCIIISSGAYFTYLIKEYFGFPLVASGIVAVFLSAVLGVLLYYLLYRRMIAKKTSPLILLLVSLGAFIILQNLVSIVFGNDILVIRESNVSTGHSILGAHITTLQLIIIALTCITYLFISVFLSYTKYGKAIKAVSCDIELAEISGISSHKIMLVTFAIGSAIGGLSGVLLGLDTDLVPWMGLQPMLIGVVIVIVSGSNRLHGIAIAASLFGIIQHFGVWKIGPQWQDTIIFAVFLVILILRPNGLFGKKSKKAAV
ncbi:MAG: branched-chain amino acid ABC transporter permease [candidate division Zixibacteria bacterium]|nr:branched-chain amino acid ABC transporter permease [candidate division Zixibacteria bacterium]